MVLQDPAGTTLSLTQCLKCAQLFLLNYIIAHEEV